MPSAPADPVEVDRLAAEAARLEREWPAGAFSRLTDRLADSEGHVEAALRFHRIDGFAAIDGRVTGLLHLRCERCLAIFEWPLEATFKLCFVADEAQAGALPGEYEPALAPGGRAALDSLVEDELLLSLPLAPAHADPGQCAATGFKIAGSATARQAEPDAPAQTVQRPFAGLRDWLKK